MAGAAQGLGVALALRLRLGDGADSTGSSRGGDGMDHLVLAAGSRYRTVVQDSRAEQGQESECSE